MRARSSSKFRSYTVLLSVASETSLMYIVQFSFMLLSFNLLLPIIAIQLSGSVYSTTIVWSVITIVQLAIYPLL
jgi:hypothetical protein